MITTSQNLPSSTLEDEKITLMCVGISREDFATLRDIFAHPRWRLSQTATCRDAHGLLERKQATVVLCERKLPDGDWRRLLEEVSQSDVPPPVVVVSRTTDQDLWAEVLNLGGYDVLLRPFDKSEVLRVVSMAWRHHQSRTARAARVSV